MAFYFQLNSWKQGTSERGPVNWPIYQFLDGWWTTPCRTRKCIPRGYTAKGNCFLGRTKLSLGQLFPFLDHQLCLASLRSADNLLMIAESEKLSLGKFCSSSKTFLSSIPCRNIYSLDLKFTLKLLKNTHRLSGNLDYICTWQDLVQFLRLYKRSK